MNSDLAIYTPPSQAEWQQTNELVKAVATTEFVPAAMRGKPAAVLACVLTGRELGIGPMQALKHIAIIEGKPGLSAELMAGLVRSRGHKLRIITRAPDEAEVEGVRADDPQHPLRVRWTLAMAVQAKRCTIKDGQPYARDKQGRPMPWELYPDALLLARAISALCRALFSDVTAGFTYTPEEIQSSNGQTEVIWDNPEDPEVDLQTGEVLEDPAGLAATHAAPASPAAPTLPTHAQIDAAANVAAAVQLAKTAPPDYQDAVKAAALSMTGEPWATWSRSAPLEDWRVVLHHALQTVNQSAGADGGNGDDRAPAARPQGFASSAPAAAGPASSSPPTVEAGPALQPDLGHPGADPTPEGGEGGE